MHKINEIFKSMIFCFLKISNIMIRKKVDYVYFIPHPNSLNDNTNIINYNSDNVLSLINYMLHQSVFNKYTFFIEIYEDKNTLEYIKHCENINNKINIKFIKHISGVVYSRMNNFLYFARCKYCFTAEPFYDFSFKTKNQYISCLGYFTPFKNDFTLSNMDYENRKKIINNSFDLYVTTSDISSRILSVDTGISYYKFFALGFPRNDIFYKETDNQKIFDELSEIAGINFEKIILYTPTFRDLDNKNDRITRNIFGFDGVDMDLLNNLLIKYNAIIIAKLHPLQNTSVIKNELPERVLLANKSLSSQLYKLLKVTDVLITDYTSIYFDFLLINKPVIFNFYDKVEYQLTRGFSYEPIELFCAGQIVNHYNDFLLAIENTLLNKTDEYVHRKSINQIFNKNHDGNSAKRICNHVFRIEQDE